MRARGITTVIGKRTHPTDRIVDMLKTVGEPQDRRVYVIRSDHWDEWRSELWVDGEYVAQAHRASLQAAKVTADALMTP
ncbi:hypothetical protein [Rhizobacter sp. Root1221]|uniref:hypothetical protein n=1 Tax=Rhizobacter sp. Root1221 TaxID=1736433 RepID=UPI0007010767|nr:hypothetical protein [Rhizobacter sp. Root1221]KQV99951.1 hypothetical protein ASC87_19820 [Rhizobacter sp. Root1221]